MTIPWDVSPRPAAAAHAIAMWMFGAPRIEVHGPATSHIYLAALEEPVLSATAPATDKDRGLSHQKVRLAALIHAGFRQELSSWLLQVLRPYLPETLQGQGVHGPGETSGSSRSSNWEEMQSSLQNPAVVSYQEPDEGGSSKAGHPLSKPL